MQVQSLKKAFTLIELLVVIAIIAILAAILFPVFAQAKEAAKKTTTLSNVKQLSTGSIIYTTDYDDLFPQTVVYYLNQFPQSSLAWPYPAGWIQGWDGGSAHVADLERNYYANSVQPYVKNMQLTEVNGGTNVYLFASDGTSTQTKAPANAGLVMNGMLNTLSTTSVDQPSLVPLYWAGRGNVNARGRGFANPNLNCPSAVGGSCVFSPGGTGSAGVMASWYWGITGQPRPKAAPYSRSTVVSRTDSSAKTYRLTLNSTGSNTNILEPWSTYDAAGAPSGIRLCSSANPVTVPSYAPCFFRPDQDGTRDKWTAIVE